MKRKKLLYVGNALSHSGRTVTHIETLSNLLMGEGYEVTITSSTPNKVLRLVDMVKTFLRCKDQVDVVLIDSYSTANFWYAVVIGRLCRRYQIPYIPILHGGNLPQRLVTNAGSCEHLFNGALVNVAPSGYLYDAFAKAGYSNLKCIPNHIHIEKYPLKLRTEIQPKLLWVRSFAKIYNPMMAIDVLRELRVSYPQAQLIMVGPDKDGSLGECEKMVHKEKLNVRFTGLLSKEEWIDLSKKAAIFINTTNFDNTPVSIIEAMALGMPIVSTDVGGIPFLIDDGIDGLLSPPNDSSQFTASITRLLKNPNLVYDLTTNARLKSKKMDWSHIKGLWHEVLS